MLSCRIILSLRALSVREAQETEDPTSARLSFTGRAKHTTLDAQMELFEDALSKRQEDHAMSTSRQKGTKGSDS